MRWIARLTGLSRRRAAEPIGETAVRLGYATSAEVFRALNEQQGRGEHVRIGLLMVEMGILTPAQLAELLREFQSERYAATEDALRLATRLKVMLDEQDQMVLVTSADQRAGVSVIAAQSALAMGLMGSGRVLLIDANPYDGSRAERPIYAAFGAPDAPGFVELLSGTHEIEQVIFRTGVATLDIMPLGMAGADFVGPLLSKSCTALFQTLRKKYRFIFVDAPALMRHPETAVLAPRSDGVLLVIPAGRVSRASVVAVKEMIDGLNVPILGAVLSERGGRLQV